MKTLFVHNDYYRPSGEEHAVEGLAALLQEHGDEVIWYRRGSVELNHIVLGKLRAPFLSICNPRAIREVKRIIREKKPDLVQVQNLYPLISPRVLKAIKSTGIPVVMRCPNYRLFCPTGLFYDSSGNICEKCTGSGHELWCIRKNCMGNRGKSISYALRNFVARKTNVFRKYVDLFVVLSEFQKGKFIENGIPRNKIFILPGLTPHISDNEPPITGSFVTFVGRVSREKGIDDFLSAAGKMPDLKYAVAGSIPEGVEYKNSPANVEWKGFLSGNDLDDLFRLSAAIVVPSKCWEGFPNVITRAMYHSKPVITTDLGCFPDIIEHGVNGLTFPTGDINALITQISRIVSNPSEAEQMGKNGREKAEREYSREVIYKKLMEIYSRVTRFN